MGVPGINRPHCPPLSQSDATEARCAAVRSGFARFYSRHCTDTTRRFLNKNPHLSNKLPFLRAIFPDASIIITSRDLRSTVLSTQVLWMRLEKAWGVRHYLPQDLDACWSCVPPAPEEDIDPARLFPGGDLHVLAEYWLRTYERIECTIGGFDRQVTVRHRDFVTHPVETLERILTSLDLASSATLPSMPLDASRNERWRVLLSSRERRDLETFIGVNRARIERLKYTDTTL